jgi:hypothetical protein
VEAAGLHEPISIILDLEYPDSLESFSIRAALRERIQLKTKQSRISLRNKTSSLHSRTTRRGTKLRFKIWRIEKAFKPKRNRRPFRDAHFLISIWELVF